MHTIRSLVCALLASLVLATAVHGQNLIINSDFESGSLTPWTSTGDVQVSGDLYGVYGDYGCAMAPTINGSHMAKIQQTVSTTVGTLYYLALDIVEFDPNSLTSFTISAVPAAGGNAEGSVDVPFNPNTAVHRTLFFHATTTSTKVVIEMTGGPAVVDNIQLIALPPNKHAGKYTGTAQTILSSEANGVTNKESRKIVARIAATGQIVLLEGATEFAAGTLLPDGTLDIRLRGKRRVFTPSIHGTRIQFTLNSQPNLLDEGGNELDAVMRTVYTLTRVR